MRGAGLELHGFNSSWYSGADTRHLDLRSSLLNPFGHWITRQYRATTRSDIHILLDTSASMNIAAGGGDLHRLISLLECIIFSTFMAGDRSILWAAAERGKETLHLPPACRMQLPFKTREMLSSAETFSEAGSQGMLEIAGALPKQKSLIFVLSDFYWPQALLENLLPLLGGHETLFIRTRDNINWISRLPDWRLMTLHDPESCKRYPIISRPHLKKKWLQRENQWLDTLRRHFSHYGSAMISMTGELEPMMITRHFFPE